MLKILKNNTVYFGLDELELYTKVEDIKIKIDEKKKIFFYQKEINFNTLDLIFKFENLDEDNTSSASINIQWINFTYSVNNSDFYKKTYSFYFISNKQIKKAFSFCLNQTNDSKTTWKSKIILYSDFLNLINHEKINFHKFLKNFLCDYKLHNLQKLKLKKSENIIWDININWVDFHFEKIKPAWFEKGFKFSFIFNDEIVNSFSINFANDTKSTAWKHVFLIYSQILTYFNRKKLPFDLYEIINQFIKIPKKPTYRRLDICNDLNVSKTAFLQYFKKFDSKIKLDSSTWLYQTYYTRDIKTESNRAQTIRIYDKKLDSYKKKKISQYDHLHYDNVNRIEVEVRSEKAKTIKNDLFSILHDKDLQKEIFLTYLNEDLNIYIDPLKLDIEKSLKITKEIKEKNNLEENYLKLWYVPKRTLAQANWYARNILHQTWWDWFMQYVFWFFPDEQKTQIINKDWKILRFDIQRQPDDLLDNMFIFMKERLNMPQKKVNSLIKELTQKHYSNKIKLTPKN